MFNKDFVIINLYFVLFLHIILSLTTAFTPMRFALVTPLEEERATFYCIQSMRALKCV